MTNRKAKKDIVDSQLAKYERMVKASEKMSADEKAELATWEAKNVTGGGPLATSDWPGWDAVFQRTSH